MGNNCRFVRLTDAAELAAIYAPYVLNTAISFECQPPTVEEFRRRIEEIRSDYPYLVWEEEGRLCGYAYAHRHMARQAYQWNAELSVYISPDHQHRGIGRALYQAIIDILRLQNIRHVYAGITSPNPASEAIHTELGFSRLGVYHRTGYKCGAWHDVAWWEKELAPCVDKIEPHPFTPLAEVDKAAVETIIKETQKKARISSDISC